RLVPAGLGQIKAALGRQSALIEAALALELLLGVAQRGPRLTDVRLGSLDLLRPAAASIERDARLGDADARERGAKRLPIRLRIELGQHVPGRDPVALLEAHRIETPRHPKAEIDLADVDVAVQRQRTRFAAIGEKVPG